MGGFGARTLLIAAGAVSMGIGAGFERSLQDAWTTAALPQSAAMAMPAATARHIPPSPVPRIAPLERPLAQLPTQAPRVEPAATASPPATHPAVERTAQRDSFIVKNVAVATPSPIAAAKGDKPTDVAPDVSEVQGAPIDAVAVQAPPTPTPSPTPTPTPTPQPKKPWIHRQLNHLNPFKPSNRASTPAPSNPRVL